MAATALAARDTAKRIAGFWAEAVSFEAAAKRLAKLSPEGLLVAIEEADAVADRPAALRRINSLERALRRIRERLEQVPDAALDFSEADRATDEMIQNRELLDSAAFSEKLGWTRQALSKALAANRLFFIEHRGVRYFPAFFADRRYERRQLEAISKLMGHLPGGSKLQFFLNPRGSLGKKAPLQALERGQLSDVKAAAEGFAQG